MGATTLSSATEDSREVVRCDKCLLVQFRTENNQCRKCHASFVEVNEPIVANAQNSFAPLPPLILGNSIGMGRRLTSIRLARGLSQRAAAERMHVPRTYVSKIETGKATPTLSSFVRFAIAYDIPLPEFVGRMMEPTTAEGLSISKALITDAFLRELFPYVGRLDLCQKAEVLMEVRVRAMRRDRALSPVN